ncbi:MAG: HXXEE domain-containing protein [Anaerolineales bacterium]|nr:HXXEE domain-containing protein [Anaerolineales bacterium]
MDLTLLMASLPVVFMLHDFEEIIMFEPWLRKYRDEVRRRFPPLDRILRAHHDRLSTPAFAVAVLHEFVLVAGITFAALALGWQGLWFGAFAAFGLHLLVHIGQWLIFRKYVPCVATSLLALPYCGYVLVRFLGVTAMSAGELLIWTLVGLALTAVSFPSAFALAARFERWINRSTAA